jgi:ABC-type transport system involved in multi-copper enzyme maturation permease subunit
MLAKWDIYALTMPVSREDMVSSKYIMLILLTLFGTAFSSIITIGINVALKADSLFTSVSNSFIGAIVVIMLYSIVLPFIIKLGVEKARIIFFVAMIIPFVVVSSISAFMKEETSEIPGWLVSGMDFLSHYSGIVLPIIALAVLYLSYRISVVIYRKKDF